MFTALLPFTLVIAAAQASAPQSSTATLTVTPAPPVVEFDLRRLKGPLVRQLAWSPDHTEIYLQTYEANRDASVKQTFHYLIPATGGAPRQVDTPPGWAVAYQAWKSGQASPADATWKIDVTTEKKIQSATSIPMGGDLARGGTVDPTSGLGIEAAASAAAQSSNVNVYTMRLSGRVVGEWINHPIVPGLTFGWGPTGTPLIAFADPSGGKLTVMDREGKALTVDGTKDVTLPAFTHDGQRIAFLQKTGRSSYALVIAAVKQK